MPLWISASSVSKLFQQPFRSSTRSHNVPKLDSSRDTLNSKLVTTSLNLPWVAPFSLNYAHVQKHQLRQSQELQP
ncbi:hypothetical protein PanWU01x14_262640 [Parasponia andersonii]|uniref:Uncharacterized protein n=1 Tax=Parasponia andersonii TaxID=3476 RepID=A0A2P5B897_PARAD|nr:hypothetical protein PanWU01x14_262640 [Parasponia andersonii]